MAYDEELAQRVREQLAVRDDVTEKAMFGGLAFLVRGNMAVTVSSHGGLMVRLGQEGADAALARPHTRPLVMSGRPLRGWIRVGPEGLRTKRQLTPWVKRGTEFAATLPAKG